MEEKNNQIKVKLSIIIVLILVIAIITFVIVYAILNKNNDSKTNNIGEIQNTQEEDKQADKRTNNADIDFSFKFLKMENKKENMIYSPLSIKYALQMLNEGADGNTKTQIENVIRDTNLVKYDNINDILSLANALYIRDTYSQNVKDEFKNKLLNAYNAEINYDAFKNADNINNWIETKTLGQIKNMLRDEIVTDPDTEMILINALAIDMAWQDGFDGENTHGDTFYLENGQEMTATMMNQETKSDNISYYKDNKITAIAMDLKEYENNQMEFIAIMPDDNLSNYVENFDIETLENITDNLTLASKTTSGLNIFIPRFSFDYDLALKNDLINMGITEAFDENLADFSNITNLPEDLYVSDALHKANIDFSEKGVKAAASTVISIEDTAAILTNSPKEIRIDKPFMYLIKDKKTDEIWFVGTVYNPNSWENDKANYIYR